MSLYFSLSELTRSDTVNRLNGDKIASNDIDNTPGVTETFNMQLLMNNLLDPIRRRWGFPINVNSGYRCKALNDVLKGSKTSQHMTGEAADITVGTYSNNRKLFDLIKLMSEAGEIEFDQLIDESNYQWIHISYRQGKNRKQILHL